MQDMEKQVKEFATGLEQLVDRFISGELGNEIGKNMDKHMTGFIHHFEDGYSKFEQASHRFKLVQAGWPQAGCCLSYLPCIGMGGHVPGVWACSTCTAVDIDLLRGLQLNS